MISEIDKRQYYQSFSKKRLVEMFVNREGLKKDFKILLNFCY